MPMEVCGDVLEGQLLGRRVAAKSAPFDAKSAPFDREHLLAKLHHEVDIYGESRLRLSLLP
jgi:hypothetical protein